MRCTSYCIASNLNLLHLYENLLEKYSQDYLKKYREVLHIFLGENDKDIFVFTYGAIIFWGFSKEEEDNFYPLLALMSKSL